MSSLNAPADFRAPRDDELRARFGHVTTWVFDLDNTLYPLDAGVWRQIDQRISLFLIDLFGLDGYSARALHQHYYQQYGTTLRGLVEEHLEEAAERFLEFVHDIDRSMLIADPVLAREIERLPGRKLVFTNGSRNHALLTLRQLGLEGLFEDTFDIVDASLMPKPAEAAYDVFFQKFGVDPKSAAMFEDVAKNLVPAKARGVTTVLVTARAGQADHREAHDRLPIAAATAAADFTTDNLGGFLTSLNEQLKTRTA